MIKTHYDMDMLKYIKVSSDESPCYFVDFEIYECVHDLSTNAPLFKRATADEPTYEWVNDISQGTPSIRGTLKWDGCINYVYPEQEHVMLHHCGFKGFLDEVRTIEKMFKLASELMPNHHDLLLDGISK